MGMEMAVAVLDAGAEVLDNLGLTRLGPTTVEEVLLTDQWGVAEREGRTVIVGGFAGLPPEALILTQITGEGAVSGVWSDVATTYALTDTRPGHEMQWVVQEGEVAVADGVDRVEGLPEELDEESLWELVAARTGLGEGELWDLELTAWTAPSPELLDGELG